MGLFSSAKSTQQQIETTTQVDNRIGASDQAVVGTHGARIGSTETSLSAGGDLLVQSLDPETIQGAFGLTDTVVNQLSGLANTAVVGGQNLAEKLSSSASGTLERVTSGFGNQLSDLAVQKASGGLNSNLVIMLALAALGALFIWKKK